MADNADIAADLQEVFLARSIRAARAPIPIGIAGDCEECGDASLRLVGGWCAPCRDDRAGRRAA